MFLQLLLILFFHQVNNNGDLTFDEPFWLWIPYRFPAYVARDIIAPFWTDMDTRVSGEVYYDQYTNGSVVRQATQDINQYFPELNFNATWVFVATWYEVAYYPTTGTVSQLPKLGNKLCAYWWYKVETRYLEKKNPQIHFSLLSNIKLE